MRADAVVAPSQWMLDSVREHYEHPMSERVIYNGRSPSLFQPSQHKSNCVFSVGRLWDKGKQIRLLLEREQAVPVYIAGSDQPPNATYKSGASSLSSGARVSMLGNQSEEQLSALYSRSSLYAATSCYEPFGLAPLEAALSGCALVANDVPTFRELWGDAAVYFHRNDPDALAEAIRRLEGDSHLRTFHADRVYKRARACFDSQQMVQAYENLYREVACKKAAA
jgi:glycosyltransferase involved in cell wall biosynthesis